MSRYKLLVSMAANVNNSKEVSCTGANVCNTCVRYRRPAVQCWTLRQQMHGEILNRLGGASNLSLGQRQIIAIESGPVRDIESKSLKELNGSERITVAIEQVALRLYYSSTKFSTLKVGDAAFS